MPIVGSVIGRIGARKLLTFGVLLGIYTLWLFSSINLNVGFWDLFVPQFLWGASAAFIFVPLTTITFNSIPHKDIGNATSVYGLIRNLGGGIGVSSVATMVTRMTQRNFNQLGAHVTLYDSATQQVLGGALQMFMSHGMDSTTAGKQAYAALFGMVQRQAAMLSFVQVFRLLAVFFVAALLLIPLMRPPRYRAKDIAAH